MLRDLVRRCYRYHHAEDMIAQAESVYRLSRQQTEDKQAQAAVHHELDVNQDSLPLFGTHSHLAGATRSHCAMQMG